MDDVTKVVTAIFGGVITLAIISTIIGRNSKAPAAIQATASAVGTVVAAAEGHAPSGNNGLNAFTLPGT
jgi:hypothetical protein